jgi:hypothetical protein
MLVFAHDNTCADVLTHNVVWKRAHDGHINLMCAHACVYRNIALTSTRNVDQGKSTNVCIGSLKVPRYMCTALPVFEFIERTLSGC